MVVVVTRACLCLYNSFLPLFPVHHGVDNTHALLPWGPVHLIMTMRLLNFQDLLPWSIVSGYNCASTGLDSVDLRNQDWFWYHDFEIDLLPWLWQTTPIFLWPHRKQLQFEYFKATNNRSLHRPITKKWWMFKTIDTLISASYIVFTQLNITMCFTKCVAAL